MENLESLKAICHRYNPKVRYTHAALGAYPESRFLCMDVLENTIKAKEQGFFEEFFKTRHQIELSAHSVAIINPMTGLIVDPDKGFPKEVILAGAREEEILKIQAEIVAQSVYPDRLELGSLSMLGGLIHYQKSLQLPSAMAVVEWGSQKSSLMICSAKRVEMLRTIPFGEITLLQRLKSTLSLKDEAAAARILSSPGFDFNEMGTVLLREFIKQLQAAISFFEVQTGQSLKSFIVTLLPKHLSWVDGVLSQHLGPAALTVDYAAWLNASGLKLSADVPALSNHHFGVASLVMTAETDAEKKSS